METFQAILSRRSIRRFQQKAISKDLLIEIVRAGTYAASAGNAQPWRFVIVQDPKKVLAAAETLGWLAGKPEPDQYPTAHIVVLIPKDPGWAKQADAAAAVQNMLLAATDRGIGSCWFGSIQREDLSSLLHIPGQWHIYSVIALGYADEEPMTTEAQGNDVKVHRAAHGRLVVPKRPLKSLMAIDSFE